jgi:hypothetical protein
MSIKHNEVPVAWAFYKTGNNRGVWYLCTAGSPHNSRWASVTKRKKGGVRWLVGIRDSTNGSWPNILYMTHAKNFDDAKAVAQFLAAAQFPELRIASDDAELRQALADQLVSTRQRIDAHAVKYPLSIWKWSGTEYLR